jgi:hypothetical protein
LLKDLCRSDVWWHDDAVVHPFSLAASRNNAGSAKIRKVSRDLWLRLAKDLDKIADANFLLSHEIQKSQTSIVTQSLKEAFQAEPLLCSHVSNISALTDVLQRPYIRIHIGRNLALGLVVHLCMAVVVFRQ